MDAIRKLSRGRRGNEISGRKLNSPNTSNDCQILNSSETDGPFNLKDDARKKQAHKNFVDMPPDKHLDERVLLCCWEFLADNLPAEDVAPMMASQDLLTPRENDEYRAMKRSGKSIINLSEFLLECLRKRVGGSLKKFCTILWKIEAAKYLGNNIRDVYNAAYLQEGFNPSSRDRLSRVSLSDSDLSQRSKSSKGNITQSCAVCKQLKKQNRHLEKENSELYDKYGRLQEAKIKIEAQLDVLQDQLQHDEIEKQNLTRVFPKLHESITQIERYCRMSETLRTQQTLKKINSLMREQNDHDRNPIFMRRRNFRTQPGERSRESMLSMLSDNSSMADCSTADEELTRSTSHTCEINSPLVTSSDKTQAFSDAVGKSPPVRRERLSSFIPIHGNKETETTTLIPQEISATKAQNRSPKRDTADSLKETHQNGGHYRSESSPSTSFTKQRSNTHPKKGRNNSVSGYTMSISTRHVRSQSVKNGSRHGVEHASPLPLQHLRDDSELLAKLDKRRQKLESQSNPPEQHQACSP